MRFQKMLRAAVIPLAVGATSKDALAQRPSLPPIEAAQDAREQALERKKAALYLGLKESDLKGLRVNVPIDRGVGGNYIVHVRQMHTHPTQQEATIRNRKEIVKSQSMISDFILKIYKRWNLPCIYDEGITPEFEKFFPIYRIMADAMKLVDADLAKFRTFEQMQQGLDLSESVLKTFNTIEQWSLFGNRVRRHIDTIEGRIPKAEANKQPELRRRIAEMRGKFQDFEKKYGPPNPLLFGALVDLSMKHGIPVVCAAETEEDSNAATDLLKKIDSLAGELRERAQKDIIQSMLIRLELMTLESEKQEAGRANDQTKVAEIQEKIDSKVRDYEEKSKLLRSLVAELDKAMAQYDPIVLEKRNATAIRMMMEDSQRKGQPRLKVSVYGAGHYWVPDVTKWDEEHSDDQHGLIEIGLPEHTDHQPKKVAPKGTVKLK